MTRHRNRQAWPCIALCVAVATPAGAQVAAPPPAAASTADEAAAAAEAAKAAAGEKAQQDSKVEAGEITKEVLSTTAPAFTALGVTGQVISEPEGLKRFAAGAITGVDVDGKPVTGAGIQFSPAQLFPGLRIDYLDYKRNYTARALARLQVTAGYVRADAGAAGNPDRAAIGAIWVPFDTTDPFVNEPLDKCLQDAFNHHHWNKAKAPPVGVETTETDKELQTKLGACRDNNVTTPTRGYSAQLGIAKLFQSRDGGKGPMVGRGFAASAVMSIGLDCLFIKPCTAQSVGRAGKGSGRIGGRLLLGAVFREREQVINPLDEKTYIDRNRQSYGARLLIGNPEKWWLGLEALRQHATYSGLGIDNYATYSVSLDFKLLGSGQWFTASYGDSTGSNFGHSKQFTVGFKYAFGPSSTLGGTN